MDDAITLPARHKLTVAAYYQMAEAGILGPDERVELIEGEVFDMAPIGQGHAAIVGELAEALFTACAGQAIVWPQHPIALDEGNAPQPDLAILRRRPDFNRGDPRPGPADVLLLVEVSDSSLRFDRTVKLPLYARARIAEVWIVDLQRRVVEAYRKPEGGGYAGMTTYRPGDRVELAIAPEILVMISL